MNYRIICIGKIRDFYYSECIEKFVQQINHRQNYLEIIEFPDEKIPERVSDKEKNNILRTEGSRILSKLTKEDYIIALCIEGKEVTTKQHADMIRNARDMGCLRITYIIGGSLGLCEEVKMRANQRMSFSKMTFPHQLMRMVLCEEIRHMTDYL